MTSSELFLGIKTTDLPQYSIPASSLKEPSSPCIAIFGRNSILNSIDSGYMVFIVNRGYNKYYIKVKRIMGRCPLFKVIRIN
jgi:hypothetical protein